MASEVEDPDRRDFLVIAGNAFVAVGAAATLWPFVAQMNPDAGAQALASVEIDLSPVKEGQAITAMWRGKPIFIRNRTPDEIKAAEAVPLADLPDQSARNDLLPESTPATDQNRVKEGKDNWLIMVGICTLGLHPQGPGHGRHEGRFRRLVLPCHGSHYDTSGRIRKGPAPRNLEVPPYEFVSDTKIKIG